ncbi:MAG: autotransporter-associated beta strand repeat-containing protein, partial [Paludibacter sp.]
MKTKKIIQQQLLINTRILFGLFMLFGLIINTNAQTTVTYAQRIANYYATSNNGGTFGDNGSYQVGMTAHASSPKQVVSWRKFRQDGSVGSTCDRSLQIGDQFVVTVSATRPYGMIGFSLLSSPSATASYADRENNYALSVYLPGPLYPEGASWAGKWTVKSNGGTTVTASFGGNQSPTWKNFTFTMTLTAVDRMNVTMTDGTYTSNFYDVQLAKSTPITDYCIYQEDDWDGGGNMGCYWGLGAMGTQHTLTDRGSMSLGSSNTSFSVSGVLTNGFAANSTTSSVNNSLTKVGTGDITLSAANTYSGTTQIDGGSLILGINNAIPSGASGVQSAVTFNGGTLSTGASSAGFSCGTSTYPMGALTVNSTTGTILMAATSSGQNLYFANSSGTTWAGNLNISGWTGTVGTSGTNGHIFVGNSASGLTASQLGRISFSGYTGSFATILSTGEIVPAVAGNPAPLFFCSGNFNPPNSWTEKNAAYMSPLSGKAPTNTTSYSLLTTSTASTVYFKFLSDFSGSGYYYGPSSNTTVSLSTAFAMPTDYRANGASYTFAGTSGNKYFIKTLGTSSSNASAVVFDLGAGGTVQTVTSVTQSPAVSSVYGGYATIVTATISGAFTGTQIPYLRYSTNSGFATSTVVAMTGSGTTYTATIPSGTNIAGNPVYYYVFTSGSGGANPATDGSNVDLFAINNNDNSSLNYTYTPLQGIPAISFSVLSPGSGTSGYVGNTVTITGSNLSGVNSVKIGGSGGSIVNTFTVLNSSTITFPAIEASGAIWVSDGNTSSTTAQTYTNLGYISNADADWNTGSTWLGSSVPTAGSAVTIANAVTLNAAATNNPVSVTINSGKSLTLDASGTLTINAGGSLTNNGTASLGGVGTVTFAGTATITGASTFNNLTLNGTTTLNNAPTVNGTLIMNSGTTLLTNSPIYGSAGILNYNLNNGYAAKYNTSLEWPASSGPSSVTLSTNSWIQLTGDRSLTGNLTISGGALQAYGALRTLTMNGTTQTVNLSGGAIYGTDNGTNNDLQLTITSGSTTTFTGNATSSADDEKKFYNLTINSGGTLALSRGILCKHGSFIVGGTLQINNNGYVQSNNTSNGALATTNASANYSSSSALIYNSGGSFNCSDKEWPTTNSPGNVTIQNS